ncbi:MAG: chromate transporter [Candidatus Caldatribacteriaceae bacterium]
MARRCSVMYLFGKFLLIGAFTWGGGYAMLPLIRKELVQKRLLEEEEFLEVLSLAQSLPGAVAINTASVAGRKLAGGKGQFAAVLGSVLPSFFSIVLLAFFLFHSGNTEMIKNFFQGAIPVVAALILTAVWEVGKGIIKSVEELVLVGIFFLLLRLFHLHPFWVVLLGGLWGILRE